MSRVDQLAVNLVRDDRDPVAEADVTQTGQLFAGPDTSGRVVGIAEQHHLDLLVGCLPFQVLEVHAVRPVLVC